MLLPLLLMSMNIAMLLPLCCMQRVIVCGIIAAYL
jgi:hypothetical protein